jgi:hypothetical protein
MSFLDPILSMHGRKRFLGWVIVFWFHIVDLHVKAEAVVVACVSPRIKVRHGIEWRHLIISSAHI